MHIGLVSDYTAVDFTCGPALVTVAMKRHMEQRGHDVTIVGPHNAKAPNGSLLMDASDLKAYPGVRVAWPWPLKKTLAKPDFDVIHSHANSLVMHYAPMMRAMHGIPCLSTNTIHLPAFAQNLLPDSLYGLRPFLDRWVGLAPGMERSFAKVYNGCDGLIVQCDGLADYWRNRGLDCPLHVIPRPIDVLIFDRPLSGDPIRADFERGSRMIMVCRHAREKDVDKAIDIFARYILPKRPDASLTLIGDGPEHDNLIKQARELGVLHRIDFVGERPQRDLPDYYANADLFLYPSISETFGQVVNEALWCGLPVVGIDDGLGVAYQVEHEESGLLSEHGPDMYEQMGYNALRLLNNPVERRIMGEVAAASSRARTHPNVVYSSYEAAYASAQENFRRNPPKPRDIRKANDMMWLVKNHLTPWLWKHAGLTAIGNIRKTSYQPDSNVRFDAVPEAAPAPAPRVAATAAPSPDRHPSNGRSASRDWPRRPASDNRIGA